jgi:hypothetical protein
MAQTTVDSVETHAGRKFEWLTTDYRSPTGGDHTRSGYRVDGKLTAWRAFYDALAAAKAEEA